MFFCAKNFVIPPMPVFLIYENISTSKYQHMKKGLLLMLPWILQSFFYKAMAQEEGKKNGSINETEEIVIRKKGDKDVKVILELTGDKLIINGKPLMEFNDEGLTINKRKIIVREGNKLIIGDGGSNMDFGDAFSWNDDKAVKKAFLGVTTEKVEEGAKIMSVSKESAAAKAGLEKDDVITKINGIKIDGPQALSDIISTMKPGDEVKVSYKRNGKSKSAKTVLQARAESRVRSFSFNGPDGSFKTFTIPSVPGFRKFPDGKDGQGDLNFGPDFERSMENLEKFEFNFDKFPRKQKLGIRIQDIEEGMGVKILDVESKSAAETAGLAKDDIVTEIAGVKVNNTDDARELLRESADKSSYTIKIDRKGQPMTFTVKIPKKLKTADL